MYTAILSQNLNFGVIFAELDSDVRKYMYTAILSQNLNCGVIFAELDKANDYLRQCNCSDASICSGGQCASGSEYHCTDCYL
jgi:hypothetical protein